MSQGGACRQLGLPPLRCAQIRADSRVNNPGVIFLAFLAVPAQHLIRFPDEALGLGDALPEAVLACLDFCCVLLSPLSALYGVWHSGSTILAQLRTHDFQLSFLRFETSVCFPLVSRWICAGSVRPFNMRGRQISREFQPVGAIQRGDLRNP